MDNLDLRIEVKELIVDLKALREQNKALFETNSLLNRSLRILREIDNKEVLM